MIAPARHYTSTTPFARLHRIRCAVCLSSAESRKTTTYSTILGLPCLSTVPAARVAIASFQWVHSRAASDFRRCTLGQVK